MAGFKWPNISWGVDILTFALFKAGGFTGLTIGAAVVMTLAFVLFSKAYKLDYWEKAIVFPLLLYLLNPINANSFKGQLVSLTMLGALIYILSQYKEKGPKMLFFLPILFLVWANLHGLFLVGLGIFGIWQISTLFALFLENKRIKDLFIPTKQFSAATLTSVLATLIHPYGIKIYENAFFHFNNPLLKSVLEYLPPEELSPQWFNLFLTAILGGIGIGSFVLGKKIKEKIPEVTVFWILYILSLWVKRYAWAMYYTLIPLLQPIANFIKPDTKKGRLVGATTLFGLSTLLVLYIKLPFSQYTNMTWETYCSLSTSCSIEGSEKLKDYYIEGKTMTLYNWGGFLIWNNRDLKPSTDGRMHLWRDETGYSAFEYDYKFEQNAEDIDKSKYDVVFTSKSKPIYERLKTLASENKWVLVYEDKTSVIFKRAD